MLILRPIQERDLGDLLELAGGLDSVNLPRNREFLEARIENSQRSFAGGHADPQDAVYTFVLEDLEKEKTVGTSLIIAKQGRPGLPYYWLEVSTEERRSAELDRRFVHTKLRLRFTEDGPTEVGGLILHPDYRGHPGKWGKALSVVRFAYISAYPDRFEQQVIAEMLSSFAAPGKNRLWEAFGARFTGLPYREADHLSAKTKQFIADLFPVDPVYVTLFPEDVQEMIGVPNDSSLPAVRILEKLGFQSMNQVDPFDGGPYYGAARDAIVSVRERRDLVLPGEPRLVNCGDKDALALLSAEGHDGFRATVVPLGEDDAPQVSATCRRTLGVRQGNRVSITPLP